MADFNNIWRKRLACEQCRHLKVRCEYSSLTNDTCIRCEKSNTPCIIPNSKRKDGKSDRKANGGYRSSSDGNSSPDGFQESKDSHAVYLRQIVRDAEAKLAEMKVPPLLEAISAGLYTLKEANSYYEEFRHCPNTFPALSLLNLPPDIMELSNNWPWLAIAIVTAVAINSVGKPVSEIQLFIQDLYRPNTGTHRYTPTLDRQLAFAIICQYALSFIDRELSVLLMFHGLTIATMKELHKAGQCELEKLAVHVAAATIIPYSFLRSLSPLRQIAQYYSKAVNIGLEHGCISVNLHLRCECSTESDALSTPQAFTASPLMEVFSRFEEASNDIAAAQTSEEVSRIIEDAISFIELMANHTLMMNVEFAKRKNFVVGAPSQIPNSEKLMLSPLQGSFFFAEMMLLKKAASQIMDIQMSSSVDLCKDLLHNIIVQAADIGGRILRAFAHLDSAKPFVRTATFYHVTDALLILQMMRFVAFACGINCDVRSECLLEVVSLKWEEMLLSSILVRQLYLLLFESIDMSAVQIGIYDKRADSVVGTGLMANFDIIYYDTRSKMIKEKQPCTQAELFEMIRHEHRKRHLGADSTNWTEKIESPTLPTVLNLLFFQLT